MKAFLYRACAIIFSHFVLYPDYRISFFIPLAFRFADYRTREFLHEVMSLAWQFVKRNGYTMSEAMKVAWANLKLKGEMKKKIVKFYFKKVDGSVREAYGTLNEKLMPAITGTDNRKKNDTVQTYYDTERQEFRCFKKANLMSIA